MKKNALNELRKQNNELISKSIEETTTKIVDARMRMRRGEAKNLKEVANLSRTLAQLKTLLTEKNIEGAK